MTIIYYKVFLSECYARYRKRSLYANLLLFSTNKAATPYLKSYDVTVGEYCRNYESTLSCWNFYVLTIYRSCVVVHFDSNSDRFFCTHRFHLGLKVYLINVYLIYIYLTLIWTKVTKNHMNIKPTFEKNLLFIRWYVMDNILVILKNLIYTKSTIK